MLAIAKFEIQAQHVQIFLSTALQSDITSVVDTSIGGSSVVSTIVPTPIGICELFHQWREILVTNHRIIFSNQLSLTSKWLGEEVDPVIAATNENNYDQPYVVVSGEAIAGGSLVSPSPSADADAGAGADTNPGSDAITNTNRNAAIDLGLLIPSIRQLTIQPSSDD